MIDQLRLAYSSAASRSAALPPPDLAGTIEEDTVKIPPESQSAAGCTRRRCCFGHLGLHLSCCLANHAFLPREDRRRPYGGHPARKRPCSLSSCCTPSRPRLGPAPIAP